MKKNKTIELIISHYNENIELGVLYDSLSVLSSQLNCENLSKYLKELSNDKLTIHKDLISEYITSVGNELNSNISLDSKKQISKLKTAKNIIDFVYDQELKVRDTINNICNLALEEKDFESFNFIQWFVKDGLKDFNEIEYIKGLFDLSDNLLQIDNNIKNVIND